MTDHTEAEDTPIAHYHRPDGVTCSLVETSPRAASWLSPRAASWLHIFHRASGIPLTSCYPVLAKLPGRVGLQRVYMLDLTRITGAERARLIAHIVKTFNVPAHQVEEDLDAAGCPILATDVTVAIPMRLLT